jgi:hypothetical protein
VKINVLAPKKKKNKVNTIATPNNPLPISLNIIFAYLLLKCTVPKSSILYPLNLDAVFKKLSDLV